MYLFQFKTSPEFLWTEIHHFFNRAFIVKYLQVNHMILVNVVVFQLHANFITPISSQPCCAHQLTQLSLLFYPSTWLFLQCKHNASALQIFSCNIPPHTGTSKLSFWISKQSSVKRPCRSSLLSTVLWNIVTSAEWVPQIYIPPSIGTT